MSRVFIGNLPVDISDREIEDVFRRYGTIRSVDVKTSGGRGAFAFVEFGDARDAEDAVRAEHDRSRFGNERMRVELSRGRGGGYGDRDRDDRGGYGGRDGYDRGDRGGYDRRGGGDGGYGGGYGGDRGGGRNGLGPSPYGPSRKTNYRILVSGLEPTMSWQDLKDHFRDFKLEVTHADVYRDGNGTVSFASEDDMERALDKADDTTMKNLRGECRIRVKADAGGDDYGRGRSGDRSPPPRRRSPAARSRSRSASPKYSAPRGDVSPRD